MESGEFFGTMPKTGVVQAYTNYVSSMTVHGIVLLLRDGAVIGSEKVIE
jgi:hypothetical protein